MFLLKLVCKYMLNRMCEMNLSASNSGVMSFKSNTVNENEVQYYKSNKGTIAGAILAVPAVYQNIKPAFIDVDKAADAFEKSKEQFSKIYKDMGLDPNLIEKNFPKNYKEIVSRGKKLAIPFAIVAGVCTLGAGILFDIIRNKKASEAANDLATGNYNNIYANGGGVGISASGVPYYKSNNGARYGAATGAICGMVKGFMNMLPSKQFNVMNLFLPMLSFTLGGMIMGTISQKAANKAADKNTYIQV